MGCSVCGSLAVPGLVVGEDLASCCRRRCLYVSDSGRLAVHRVDTAGNSAVWPLHDKPASLAVTAPPAAAASAAHTSPLLAGQPTPPPHFISVTLQQFSAQQVVITCFYHATLC